MKRTDVGASMGIPRCIRFVRREIFRFAQNDRLCVGACIARPNRVKFSKADCFTLTVGAGLRARPSGVGFCTNKRTAARAVPTDCKMILNRALCDSSLTLRMTDFCKPVGADALIRPSKIQFHVKLTVTHQSASRRSLIKLRGTTQRSFPTHKTNSLCAM